MSSIFDGLGLQEELRAFVSADGKSVDVLTVREFLKSHYRRVALAHHPDKKNGDKRSMQVMQNANAAYDDITKTGDAELSQLVIEYVNDQGNEELLAAAAARIGHLQEEKGELYTRLREAQATMVGITQGRRLRPADIVVGNYGGRIITLDNAVAEISRIAATGKADPKKVKDLEARLAAANTRSDQWQGNYNKEKKDRDGLVKSYDEAQRRIREYEGETASLKRANEGLQAKVRGAEELVTGLVSETGSLKITIKGLQARTNGAEEYVGQLVLREDLLRHEVAGYKRDTESLGLRLKAYEDSRGDEDPLRKILWAEAEKTDDSGKWALVAEYIAIGESARSRLDEPAVEQLKYAIFKAMGDSETAERMASLGQEVLKGGKKEVAEIILTEVVKQDEARSTSWGYLSESIEPAGSHEREEWKKYCAFKAEEQQGNEKASQLYRMANRENTLETWYGLAKHLAETEDGNTELLKFALFNVLEAERNGYLPLVRLLGEKLTSEGKTTAKIVAEYCK